MLRITLREDGRSATLKLEGRLLGPWVDELERTWRAIPSPDTGNLLVDLCAVSSVDARGKDLLARMHRSGAKLTADTLMTRYIIEQVTDSRNGKED